MPALRSCRLARSGRRVQGGACAIAERRASSSPGSGPGGQGRSQVIGADARHSTARVEKAAPAARESPRSQQPSSSVPLLTISITSSMSASPPNSPTDSRNLRLKSSPAGPDLPGEAIIHKAVGRTERRDSPAQCHQSCPSAVGDPWPNDTADECDRRRAPHRRSAQVGGTEWCAQMNHSGVWAECSQAGDRRVNLAAYDSRQSRQTSCLVMLVEPCNAAASSRRPRTSSLGRARTRRDAGRRRVRPSPAPIAPLR
jgi:hypothetical protein